MTLRVSTIRPCEEGEKGTKRQIANGRDRGRRKEKTNCVTNPVRFKTYI